MMISNEFLASEILGHGAYLCVRRSGSGDVRSAGANRVAALAQRLQLRNEFDPGAAPSRESIAFLRRRGGTKGDLADDDVLQADWVIHVAGGLAAFAFRSRFRGQVAVMRMLLLPFVIPGLTIGVALLLLFPALGVRPGLL